MVRTACPGRLFPIRKLLSVQMRSWTTIEGYPWLLVWIDIPADSQTPPFSVLTSMIHQYPQRQLGGGRTKPGSHGGADICRTAQHTGHPGRYGRYRSRRGVPWTCAAAGGCRRGTPPPST